MLHRDFKPYSLIKKNISPLNEKPTSPVIHINHDNDVENSDIEYELYFPLRKCQIYVRYWSWLCWRGHDSDHGGDAHSLHQMENDSVSVINEFTQSFSSAKI